MERDKNLDYDDINYSEKENDGAILSPVQKKRKHKKSSDSSSSKKSMFGTLKTEGGSLWKDIRKVYKFGKVIGGGSFGTVRQAYKRDDESKQLVAIKSISKKSLSAEELENLIKEVEIISSLDHANIIDFLETYQDAIYFHIVMELCTGKELFDKLVECGILSEKKVNKIIYKICKAILYCHTVGIIHRDIKAENIIFKDESENSEIKIIDFGLSKKFNPNEKMKSILGTAFYVAPEVLKGSYDEKCDVWSIGVLTFILLSGTPPFKGKNDFDIFNNIVKSDLVFDEKKFKNVSEEAINFIKYCLKKDPTERASVSELLDSEWFLEIKDETFNGRNLDKNILDNLLKFSTKSKFKRIALTFMVNLLDEKETAKLNKMFAAIDLDHKGFIDKDELIKAFKKANIDVTEEKVDELLHNVDTSEDGLIDYTEFLVAATDFVRIFDNKRIKSAFDYLDIDKSGFITIENLKEAFLRAGKNILNPEELDDVLSEINTQDKKISINEFINILDFKQ